jgi:hypothetical protein
MQQVTLLFQTKSAHSSTARPAAKTHHTPPSRSVFNSAMEDAPSDDESTAATTPIATLPVPKQQSAAAGHKTSTPHAPSKGSPALSKPQPQHSIKLKSMQSVKPPVSNDLNPSHESSVSNAAILLAAAEDSGGEEANANLDSHTTVSAPAHDILPSEDVVEQEMLHSCIAPNSTSISAPSCDDTPQSASLRPAPQASDSRAAPLLTSEPTSPLHNKLNGLSLTPRTSSDSRRSADSSLGVQPVPMHALPRIIETDPASVADTVAVDVHCFAVSRRLVEPFREPEDAPPPDLAQIEPDSALISKIDAGEYFARVDFPPVLICRLLVLSVDISAEVGRIVQDTSSRTDALSTILPSPVVMDVVDDSDCM